MRIATIQMEMKPSFDENLVTIIKNIKTASHLGANIVAFPELTLTGCHRDIRTQCDKVKTSDAWFKEISDCCKFHEIFAFVGAPTFNKDYILDSYLLINASGELCGKSHKVGLTRSEKQIFVPGTKRRIWNIGGLRIAIVLCREIADFDELLDNFSSKIDILLWPCFTSVYEMLPKSEEQVSLEQAHKVASELNCCLIQSNWANSLNQPELKNTGGSIVISKSGRRLSSTPLAQAGLGLVDLLGDSFEWHDYQ